MRQGFHLGRYAYQRKYNHDHDKLGHFAPSEESKIVPEDHTNYVPGINDPVLMEHALAARQVAIEHDKKVTPDIKQVASLAGATLEGLDHRIKSDESMRRKAIYAMEYFLVDAPTGAKIVSDALRYTSIVPSEHYADGVNTQMKAFKDLGYTVSRFSNTWSNADGYKGINTTLKTKDGYQFELQFHTKESFHGKTEAHVYFEKARPNAAATPESLAAQEKMKTIFSDIPVPPGAASIQE